MLVTDSMTCTVVRDVWITCHEQHGMQCGQRGVECFVMNSIACNVARNVWNICRGQHDINCGQRGMECLS